MNPRLDRLQPYPFQRLAGLTAGITPPADKPRISLSVGEPKHAAPAAVLDTLRSNLDSLAQYPATRAQPDLRAAAAGWANRRFALDAQALDPERHVLPVAGTREALFSFAQAVIDNTCPAKPVVVCPNPFYQIYEGATLLAGAEPYYLNTTTETAYKPDFSQVPVDIWQRTQLVYVCTPGNPTGAVMSEAELGALLDLADEHDFIVASDECYSEIYFDEAAPPPGLLQVAARRGVTDYRRSVVFHSLSKRSNLPGLRSGFVAGDGEVLAKYLQYRTYHGATISPPAQAASITAWRDEVHVLKNREAYRRKFDAVLDILSPVLAVERPDAGFYLWPRVPTDDETFTRELLAQENVMVLPGSYLSRDTHGGNPGRNHVRLALVATLEECIEAATRIRRFVESL